MSTVNLDIAGNKAVYTLGAKLAKLNEFAHDFAADSADVGGVVKMPVLSCAAAAFDAESNNYEQSTTTTVATCTLSNHLVAGYYVSQKQMSDGLGAYANLFADFGVTAGKAIANKVEETVVGQVLSGSGAGAVELSATKAGFCGLYKTAYDKNLDVGECVLVLNPQTYSKLLEVLGADVVNLQKVIEQGFVDNFLGFSRVMSSKYVDSNLKGFIAEKSAIALCGRQLPMVEGYPEYGTYTDENTGIPITQLGFLKHATGNYYISVTALFGTSIVRAGGIVPLV